MRKLQHRTNNAYGSILLIEDDKVIGAWTVSETGTEMDYYRDPGDLEKWAAHWPEETNPEAYGDLVE